MLVAGAPAWAQEQAAPAASVQASEAPALAAAASLRYALDEIAQRFEKETGKSVKLTYGATGNLVSQIQASAPFQVLFAADDKSVKKLAAAGLTDGEPVVFARGELSIAAPKDSPVGVDSDLKGLKEALAAGKVKHVAIANPETAPYGRAAQEALEKAGLLEQAKPLFVTGENIGQAATFVSTGAAEVGFIAKSLAISKEIAPKINSAVVPQALYGPINHGLAIVKGAGPVAKAFVEFVRGPKGREVLEASGFSVPTS
ncbi:MAG: molybdate ABC transporter substrate-binding protein [Hyphomicrobium sp.]